MHRAAAGTGPSEIHRQIAKACPQPLDDYALEAAARFVESNRDAASIAQVKLLAQQDAEARVCREMPINK